MTAIDLSPVLRGVLGKYALPIDGIHGVAHWARVLENGRHLALLTGADLDVVSLFAVLHDSQRINEWDDPDHGHRAALFALDLQGELFDLADSQLGSLWNACLGHTSERTHHDVTVRTCWDADRLDLGRIGVMVVKMSAISTFDRERDHRIRPVDHGASEDVHGSDRIGVVRVVTGHAPEYLTPSVFFGHRSTRRALSARIGRIDEPKQNTVLLGQLLDSGDRKPVGPRGHLFSTSFVALIVLLGSLFQAAQVFDLEHRQSAPGEFLARLVDVIVAGGNRLPLTFAAGLRSPDVLAEFLDPLAILNPVRIDEQLAIAGVDAHSFANRFRFRRWNLNDKARRIFAKEHGVLENRAGLREPVVQPSVRLDRQDDSATSNERRNLDDEIERATTTLDRGDQRRQLGFATQNRTFGLEASLASGLAGRDDDLQGLFQGHRSVAITQRTGLVAVQRLGVEFAAIDPQRADVEIDGGTVLRQKRGQPAEFGVRCLVQSYLDGAYHSGFLDGSNCGFGFLATATLAVQPRRERSQDGNQVVHQIVRLVFRTVDDFNSERANRLKPREPESRQPILVFDEQNVEISFDQKRTQLLSGIVNAASEFLDDRHGLPPLGRSVLTQPAGLAFESRLIFGRRFTAVNGATATSGWMFTQLAVDEILRHEPPSSMGNRRRQLAAGNPPHGGSMADSKHRSGFGEFYSVCHTA